MPSLWLSWCKASFMARRCDMMMAPVTGSARTFGQNCSVNTCFTSLWMIWWHPAEFGSLASNTHGEVRKEIEMPSATSPFQKSLSCQTFFLEVSNSIIFTTTDLRLSATSSVFSNRENACRKSGDAIDMCPLPQGEGNENQIEHYWMMTGSTCLQGVTGWTLDSKRLRSIVLDTHDHVQHWINVRSNLEQCIKNMCGLSPLCTPPVASLRLRRTQWVGTLSLSLYTCCM